MDSVLATLDAAIDRSLVRIRAGGAVGTGFSVGGGLVLTCAHVVGGFEPSALMCTSMDGPLTVTDVELVQIRLVLEIDWPDLALLRTDADVPPALLGVDPPREARIYGRGFAEGSEMVWPYLGVVEGAACFPDGSTALTQLKSTRIAKGVSGSPAVDLGGGRVCGVLTMTRDHHTDRGGWLVPMSVVRSALPSIWTELLERQRAAGAWGRHVLGVYDEAIDRLRTLYDIVGDGLVPPRMIPLPLIRGYASAMSGANDCRHVIVAADALYRRAHAPEQRRQALDPAEVVQPENVSALEFWTQLMHVAGRRTARLLLSVLLAVPDACLPVGARCERDAMIETLKRICPVGGLERRQSL